MLIFPSRCLCYTYLYVTGESDKKSRNLIRRAVRQNPEAVIAVTGAMPRVSPKAVEDIDGVDVIMGTGNLNEIVGRVEQVLSKEKKGSEASLRSDFCSFEGSRYTAPTG